MPSTPTRAKANLVIWHLTDSALPTGGFAHSAGLETLIQEGEIETAEEYGKWLAGYLRQASYNEALAVRFAVELQNSQLTDSAKRDALAELDQLVHACQTPKEVRASMNSMGKRWARIGAIVSPDDYLVGQYQAGLKAREFHGNPGISAGLVLAAEGIAAEDSVAAYLMQMANSMTQNAIRAIPLGQDAGQRVLVSSYQAIDQAAKSTMEHDLSDLGVVAPRLEIAQMAHEKLRSRMFMS